MPTLPSQSHTQHLDVNQKHVLRSHSKTVLYTSLPPLSLTQSLLEKYKSEKHEPLTSNTVADASGASPRLLSLAGAPIPPTAAGVGC